MIRRAFLVAVALAVGALAAPGGSAQAPAAGIPRASDGKPDFSGFWQTMNAASFDIQGHSAEMGVPAGQGTVEGGEIPYLPAALAKKKENYAKRNTDDPDLKCYLPGTPRIMYMPFPFQIFQTPRELGFLFEYVHAVRTVYTNGTPHPPGHIDWWLGDSRGKWDGDTLVVDVIDFNSDTWFDHAGNHHSDAMHLVERYSFLDADHINYEVTVEDPKTFSRPWKMQMIFYRHKEPGFQILEYECAAMAQHTH